ncbi:MAG: NUDIX domain-containing protein [Nannocystaceae bacterium]
MTSARRLLVVAGLVWLAPGRLLVQRRGAGASHGANLLEFPGGKVEAGEAPIAALARELVEEWGSAAGALVVGPIAEVLHHRYPEPGPEVVLLLYHVDGRVLGERWSDLLRPVDGAALREVACSALPAEEFLAADRELCERLRGGAIPSPWA